MTDSSSETETGRRATMANCDLVTGGDAAPDITSEMISAGVAAYFAFSLRFNTIEEIVSAIYLDMNSARMGYPTRQDRVPAL
jgi:hypothetical protein